MPIRPAIAALAACCVLPAAALADCKGEVEAGFEKQRTHAPGYHVEAEHIQGDKTARISIDYVLPDRMQQKIVSPGEPAPIETIAVSKWAWGNMGGGWEELQPQFAQTVTAHVAEMLGQPIKATGEYVCLGKVSVEGKEYVGYRSQPSQPGGDAPKDKGPGAAPQSEIVRTVYIDPASGLPVMNIIGEPKEGAKPVSRSVFSYPEKMAVEAPAAAAPAPRTR